MGDAGGFKRGLGKGWAGVGGGRDRQASEISRNRDTAAGEETAPRRNREETERERVTETDKDLGGGRNE